MSKLKFWLMRLKIKIFKTHAIFLKLCHSLCTVNHSFSLYFWCFSSFITKFTVCLSVAEHFPKMCWVCQLFAFWLNPRCTYLTQSGIVLYFCETWPTSWVNVNLTLKTVLKEIHKLSIFPNMNLHVERRNTTPGYSSQQLPDTSLT